LTRSAFYTQKQQITAELDDRLIPANSAVLIEFAYTVPTWRPYGKRLVNRQNFTADRVARFRCEPGKQQTLFWDRKTPGLGLRVTANGAKSYIFETASTGPDAALDHWGRAPLGPSGRLRRKPLD
jgi:hypothetical protein